MYTSNNEVMNLYQKHKLFFGFFGFFGFLFSFFWGQEKTHLIFTLHIYPSISLFFSFLNSKSRKKICHKKHSLGDD